MALTLEEQKALDWQASQKRRVAFKRFLQGRLKAPSGPAEQVRRNFDPLKRS